MARVPPRGRWDGSVKQMTRDCNPNESKPCEFYREIGGVFYCGVGEAFKILSKEERPRACYMPNRVLEMDPQFRSLAYLDEVIARREARRRA